MANNNELVKLCVDTYNGTLEQYSTQKGNDVIRKAFLDICGTEKIDFKSFRRHKNEVFEILEETLDQLIVSGWKDNFFFDQFVETKDIEFGDRNSFYVEDKSLLVVSKFSGGHWNLKRQRVNKGQDFSVKTSWYGVKVYEDFMRFLAGRIDFNALIEKVNKSFTNQIKQEIYTSFMGASASLPSGFNETGTFDKAKMITLCEHVSASCDNAPITIIGTKVALNKLGIDSGMYSDNMKDEKNKKGVLALWEGYNVMPIEQVHSANTFDFAVDNSKLLIMPSNAKPCKMVYEGDSRIQEITDGTTNMDGSMEYSFQKMMGVQVIFNVLYGAYTLS